MYPDIGFGYPDIAPNVDAPRVHWWVCLLKCWNYKSCAKFINPFFDFFFNDKHFAFACHFKRLEPQLPNWHQKIGNSKKFQNLTDLCLSISSKPNYTVFCRSSVFFWGGGAIVISKIRSRDWIEWSEHGGKQCKADYCGENEWASGAKQLSV